MKTNRYISDELLAAFIDGTTTTEQNNYVLEAFREDPERYDEFRIAYLGANILDDDDTVASNTRPDNGNIPTMMLGGGIAFGTFFGNVFNHSHIPMVATSNDENHFLDDRFNINHNSIFINDNNHYMETSIQKAPDQFGQEANNYISPNVDQGYSDTCAVRSQQLVLNDFGISVTQEDLIKEASLHGWYTQGEGTPLEYVGNLLENHGVEVNRFENANIFNLTNELAQGHKVIIGVDANELWHNGFLQDVKDSIIGETANHALIVAGIDTSDPNHVQVILEDPGTGDVAKAYPINQFMDAWKDSHYFMVSTQDPVPLVYNQDTMMGFDYDRGQIRGSETLLSSIENTEYLPLHPEDSVVIHNEPESIFSEHYTPHIGYDPDPIHEEYDPLHSASEIDDNLSEDHHNDDLDILHIDNNI